jgi:protein-S-isoprenylcysteine O-methyltransferase Ste14
MKSSFLERGGLWVLSQSALMIAVVGLACLWPAQVNPPVAIIAGIVLLAIGASIGVAGVIALKTNRSPFPKPKPDSQLVRQGVYSSVRHPLYTSVILLSLGWALVWGSAPAFIVALAMIPFLYAKARREEQWLRAKFPEYTDYERQAGRFLPRL